MNVYNKSHNLFDPTLACPAIALDVIAKRNSTSLLSSLTSKYNFTLARLASILNIPVTKVNASVALLYADTVLSLWQQQYHFDGLDAAFAQNMSKLQNEFWNYTIAQNSSTNKAFLTQVFTEMLNLFQSTIDLDSNGSIQRATNRLRYYLSVGEEDILLHLSRALGYTKTHKLLNASSTILVELRKTVLEGYSVNDPTYYVNITINEEQVSIPGACQNYKKCIYSNFVNWAKAQSYYGDPDSFEKVCGLLPEDKYNFAMNDWVSSFPSDIQYVKHNYGRVMWAYTILGSVSVVGFLFWDKKRQEKKNVNR